MKLRYVFVCYLVFTCLCIAKEEDNAAGKKWRNQITLKPAQIVNQALDANCPESKREAYERFVRKTLTIIYQSVYEQEDIPQPHLAFIEESLVKECKRLDTMLDYSNLQDIETLLDGFLRARRTSLQALNHETIELAANISRATFANDMARIRQSIQGLLENFQFVLLDKKINSAWATLYRATTPTAAQIDTYSKNATKFVESPSEFTNKLSEKILHSIILKKFAFQVNDLEHYITSLFYMNEHKYIPLKDGYESKLFDMLFKEFSIQNVVVHVDVGEVEKWTAVPLSIVLENRSPSDSGLIQPTKESVKDALNRLRSLGIGTAEEVPPLSLGVERCIDLLQSIIKSEKTDFSYRHSSNIPALGTVDYDTYIDFFITSFKSICSSNLKNVTHKYTADSVVNYVVQKFASKAKNQYSQYGEIKEKRFTELEKKMFYALLESIDFIDDELNRRTLSKHFQNYLESYFGYKEDKNTNIKLQCIHEAVSAVVEKAKSEIDKLKGTAEGLEEKRMVLYDSGFSALRMVIHHDLRFKRNLHFQSQKATCIKSILRDAVSTAKLHIFDSEKLNKNMHIQPLAKLVIKYYKISSVKSPLFSEFVITASTQEMLKSFNQYWENDMTEKEKNMYQIIVTLLANACEVELDVREDGVKPSEE